MKCLFDILYLGYGTELCILCSYGGRCSVDFFCGRYVQNDFVYGDGRGKTLHNENRLSRTCVTNEVSNRSTIIFLQKPTMIMENILYFLHVDSIVGGNPKILPCYSHGNNSASRFSSPKQCQQVRQSGPLF